MIQQCRRTSRSIIVILLVATITTLAPVTTPLVVKAAPTPPWYTWSFYITSFDPAAAYNLGLSQGQHDSRDLPGNQDSTVVLLFGQPSVVNNNIYGTFIYDRDATFINLDSIYLLSTSFVNGYVAGLNGEPSRLTLALGPTNLGRRTDYYSHGYAWGGHGQPRTSVH